MTLKGQLLSSPPRRPEVGMAHLPRERKRESAPMAGPDQMSRPPASPIHVGSPLTGPPCSKFSGVDFPTWKPARLPFVKSRAGCSRRLWVNSFQRNTHNIEEIMTPLAQRPKYLARYLTLIGKIQLPFRKKIIEKNRKI